MFCLAAENGRRQQQELSLSPSLSLPLARGEPFQRAVACRKLQAAETRMRTKTNKSDTRQTCAAHNSSRLIDCCGCSGGGSCCALLFSSASLGRGGGGSCFARNANCVSPLSCRGRIRSTCVWQTKTLSRSPFQRGECPDNKCSEQEAEQALSRWFRIFSARNQNTERDAKKRKSAAAASSASRSSHVSRVAAAAACQFACKCKLQMLPVCFYFDGSQLEQYIQITPN